ncbi:apolipoprotein N-acyltransferase [Sphingorhabdus arenilitoris]|uniref:Apolipoprotein N-acyltransferase n=1 Tax=Sphingorhabdus arenilitoris TaxID=1490041 RepID=A0ABV8RHS5_9SPHN
MNALLEQLKRYRYWIAPLIGALSALGFAPYHLWPVTIAALALLIHLLSAMPTRKSAFILGWLFGVGHFTIGNDWIAIAFTYQATMPVWLGYIAVFALALYLAVFPALACIAAWSCGDYVRKKGGNPTICFVLSFSAFWILTEWLRSWLFTGFAWNPLSAAMLGTSGEYAMRTIGSYGLSGLVILGSAMIWGLIASMLNANGKAIFARLLDLVLLAIVTGFFGWIGAGHRIAQKGAGTPITITQPNISQAEKYEPGYDAINFARLAQYSRPLKGQGPRLLLWPEAAIPDYLESGYPYRFYQGQPGDSAVGARQRLTQLMGEGDILITGGAKLVVDEEGQLIAARNSMITLNDAGDVIGSYDKSHLVPYGEYLPMSWLLTPLGLARLVPGDLDFWPGPGPQTLKLGPGRPNVGFQICYEIIFSGQVVDRANRPDFIFNSSNDAWFGPSGPPQHLAQARMRAIEEGLPVIRATPTGISAIIDSNGRILKSLPLGSAGRIDGTLPAADSPTIFARYGNVMPVCLALFMLIFAFLPVVSARKSR